MDYKEQKKHGTREFPIGIYNYVYDNGLNLYTHYHRELEILCIRSGRGTAYIDDECYGVEEGDILFINSGQLHGIVGDDEEKSGFVAVVFAPEFFGELDAVAGKYVIPVLNKSVHIPTYIKGNKELIGYMSQLYEKKGDIFCELKIKSIMFKVWELLISKGEKNRGNIKDINFEEIKIIIDYIKNNYQKNITLSQMAELIHVSRAYFCRKFTKIAGISPVEYLIRVRIENSCIMLKNTDMRIGDIAMECGFSGFSYYSEVFKRVMGCTPREYRDRNKK